MLRMLNRKRAAVLVCSILVAAFLFGNIGLILAQTDNIGLNEAAQIGLAQPQSGIKVVIINLIRWALSFLGIISVAMVMYGGFLWMTSAGNEERLTKAKSTLKNAIIGMIIIIFSFAIVTYIAGRFGISGWSIGGGPDTGGRPISGVGALGACTIRSVYPEPGQNDVPRNTAIIVTFREEIDPSTICQPSQRGDVGLCDCDNSGCDSINTTAVKIFQSENRSACLDTANCVTDVSGISTDNLTFVFIPRTYLGSPSTEIWHTVYLTNDIKKKEGNGLGEGIFSTCRTDWYEWDFEVSTNVDLTPPQIEQGGIFPWPDDLADVRTSAGALQATGSVTVSQNPTPRVLATTTSLTAQGNTPSARLSNISTNHTQSGVLLISVQPDGRQAVLNNTTTNRSLGSVPIDGRSVTFPNFFTLTLIDETDSFESGNSWTMQATAYQAPDNLVVGSIEYIFVAGAPVPNNGILIGANPAATAQNIFNAMSSNPDVLPDGVNNNTVALRAQVAGESGNNIALSSNTDKLTINPLSGGSDQGTNVTINDEEDTPRNSVIQITFDEAILPSMVSGNAADLKDYIKVVNLNADPTGYLEGKFMISNQYRTVEFVTDDLCGVNGCGEEIYCLPENSHIVVVLKAAGLAGCGTDNCATKAPFSVCSANVCQDAQGINHPLSSQPFDGVMDVALNSLDGDRSGEAEGPTTSAFNENTGQGEGDNYQYSFFVSDAMDISAPVITNTDPANAVFDASLSNPVRVWFNKIMMSNTITTGSIEIFNGETTIEHQLMNLWSFGNSAIGYWTSSENLDNSQPADNRPDVTRADIEHTMLPDANSFRSQVGSGLKDIYQNCYKPSDGPACTGVSAGTPSCCSGQATASPLCPQD